MNLPVDSKFHAAQELKVQTGSCNNDVCLQLLARLQQYPVPGEGFDLIGHDRCSATTYGLKQIAAGHCTDAFVPGIIARGEVAHVNALAKLPTGQTQDHLARLLGILP